MKRIVILLTPIFITLGVQSQIDTLYYDKDWKGVSNKAFADYYRIIPSTTDSNITLPFKDYFITGELQGEGKFISIDKYDDSKSIFDGECISYYKNGLIYSHSIFKKGKLNGIYTEFSENGDFCTQIEYSNGMPLYNYYTISNKDGFSSKISISDNLPIYENPSLDEIKIDYKDGEPWLYYNKNNIVIGMNNQKIRDYGKYYQASIIITNNSLQPIEFDPNNITALLTCEDYYYDGTAFIDSIMLKVYSSEEYMKKVKNRQTTAMILVGISEGLAAGTAGYSTSTTNSSYSGYSSNYGTASAYGNNSYAYGSYSGNSSYYGQSTSTTTSYNAAAAYQAQVIASERINSLENNLLSERISKNEGYLKRTTIYPGESIYGYVNIKRKSGINLIVNIMINGVIYPFHWDVQK